MKGDALAVLKKIWNDRGRYRAIVDLGDHEIEMEQVVRGYHDVERFYQSSKESAKNE